jgi:hypothetical protein
MLAVPAGWVWWRDREEGMGRFECDDGQVDVETEVEVDAYEGEEDVDWD